MRKMIFILCIPTALLSACSPSGMQGNPAAVQAGAAIGGVLGAIVGDRAGGYNGSQFGALLGTVTGAAVGNAITTPREETCQVEEYYVKTYPSSSQYEHTSSYEPSSGLRIINLRFIDDNRNHVIDAEEDSKLGITRCGAASPVRSHRIRNDFRRYNTRITNSHTSAKGEEARGHETAGEGQRLWICELIR